MPNNKLCLSPKVVFRIKNIKGNCSYAILYHTVDGRNPVLVIENIPRFIRFSFARGGAGFLNHQQYQDVTGSDFVFIATDGGFLFPKHATKYVCINK